MTSLSPDEVGAFSPSGEMGIVERSTWVDMFVVKDCVRVCRGAVGDCGRRVCAGVKKDRCPVVSSSLSSGR